jgi:hypothetical protein
MLKGKLITFNIQLKGIKIIQHIWKMYNDTWWFRSEPSSDHAMPTAAVYIVWEFSWQVSWSLQYSSTNSSTSHLTWYHQALKPGPSDGQTSTDQQLQWQTNAHNTTKNRTKFLNISAPGRRLQGTQITKICTCKHNNFGATAIKF